MDTDGHEIYFKTSSNSSKLTPRNPFQTLPNPVQTCPNPVQMCPNMSKCVETYPNTSKCSKCVQTCPNMTRGIGTGGPGDPGPLELRIYRVKFFKMGKFSFCVFFIVSILKKYFNAIFILLRNFPSKIYFHLKVQEKIFFFNFFKKLVALVP